MESDRRKLNDTIYFAADHKCTAEWKYEGFDAVKREYRYSIDGK